MKRLFIFYVLLHFVLPLSGQRDRYKFAHSYIGAQADLIGGSESPEYAAGRILIGGTHFWQKADFYISFPIFTSRLGGEEDREYGEGIITGFRYLPFGLSKSGPRPFPGAHIHSTNTLP